MTVTEFLLARIAEDEAEARKTQAWLNPSTTLRGWMGDGTDELDGFVERFANPARVLAECEAKRRIVIEHCGDPAGYSEFFRRYPHELACRVCAEGLGRYQGDIEYADLPCPTIRALASVYAEHPDYREEWRL